MAEQYDGSIRINTEINTRYVNSQMLRLTNEIKKNRKRNLRLAGKDGISRENQNSHGGVC